MRPHPGQVLAAAALAIAALTACRREVPPPTPPLPAPDKLPRPTVQVLHYAWGEARPVLVLLAPHHVRPTRAALA